MDEDNSLSIDLLKELVSPLRDKNTATYPKLSEKYQTTGVFDTSDFFYVGHLKDFMLGSFSDVLLKIELEFSLDCSKVNHTVVKRSTGIWRNEKIDVSLPYLRFCISIDGSISCSSRNMELILNIYYPKSKVSGEATRRLSIPPPLYSPPSISSETKRRVSVDIERTLTRTITFNDEPLSIKTECVENEGERETPSKFIENENVISSPSKSREGGSNTSSPKFSMKERFLRKMRGLDKHSSLPKPILKTPEPHLPPAFQKGALLISNGKEWVSLPRGQEGEILMITESNLPEWVTLKF